MRKLRFKVGDLAIFVGPNKSGTARGIGKVIEIIAVGPFNRGDWIDESRYSEVNATMDYCARYKKHTGMVNDVQLRPLKDPDVPVSITRAQEETA